MWPPLHYSSTHSRLTLPLPLPLPLPSSLFRPYDGRRISIGDCALFKPPQDSPPFIGIIRKVTADQEGNNLKLGVNWLYRPADVKLRKGILLEAAPNEVFYSFHKDEIPAASLLHTCKVAFLRKGVELPSGISAFVCRQVYDIENKCLWWLTDKDYINKRQEEINNLLVKTRIEMHGPVPSGGRSPKILSSPTSTTLSKPSSESVQNSSSVSSQGKGRKRERVGHGCDPSKRERLSKPEDGMSGHIRAEQQLKSEIAKITEKGGLIDFDGVEKFVQLMQSDGVDKKINLPRRIMLVDVIAVTDSFDCLGGFLELRGLPVLDEWLQDVRKGKIGDNGSPRDGEKTVDEFLLAVLCALEKLPVNLQALQTCNVGKSVNHLRTHKNSKIQKKARNLVDTWKKRVEAEMKLDDTKYESSRGASWSTKPVPSEVSHVGDRKFGLSAEDGVKSSTAQSASKGYQIKQGVGDTLPKSSRSSGSKKSVNMPAGGNLKDPNVGMLVAAGSSDPPLTPIKEERSSSSSHSQNSSHSCSSDHAKTAASSCREDAKSSTMGSVTVSKSSSGSWQQKSSNGVNRSTLSRGSKDTVLVKASSLNKNVISEKASPTVVQHDKLPDVPAVEHLNNQRLIVRLPNTGCSPSRAADAGGIEVSAFSTHKASPPDENHDRRVRMKTEHPQSTDVSDTNYIYQGKGGLGNSDKGIMPTACEKRIHNESALKIIELAKATQSILGPIPRLGKPYEGSLSSMNALVKSCVKFSEDSGSPSREDDVGMNLLATVAAGEITKSRSPSPSVLPERIPVVNESCLENEGKLRLSGEEASQVQCQLDDRAGVGATAEHSGPDDKLKSKNELKHTSLPVSTISTGHNKGNSVEIDKQNQASASVQLTGEDRGLKSIEKPDELSADASVAQSKSHVKSERNTEIEEANQNSAVVQSEPAAEGAKVQKEENEKLCFSSLELGDRKQNTMNKRVDCDVLTEQKASPLTKVCNDHLDNKSDNVNTPTATGNLLFVETNGKTCDDSKGLGLSVDQNGAYCKDILKMSEGLPVSHVESKLNAVFESERVKVQTSDGHPPVSTAGSGMTIKFDFNLNERIPSDDGIQGDGDPVKLSISGISSSAHLSCPLPNPISSISGSFSTSITVAAAAKGSFVPPVNLLRTTEDLGWKGSAATSAFRPAEPKRILDIHASVVMDEIPIKQFRPHLDFDLNETSVEDVASQGCPQASGSECMAHDCGKGGFGLDLNRIDEVSEVSVFSAFNNSTSGTPELPRRLSLPVELPCGSNNASRGFDLNGGPVDELGPGTALPSNPFKSKLQFSSPIPGVRMNGPEFGNFSLFPVPNSYPAITVPSILSGRGDQYAAAAAAGSQRILAPNSGTSYGSEMFRGQVLSSSTALPFSTAGPFQYPGFYFETNFPLAANTFSAASTSYVDSSTGGPLRFPNISPQLIGSTGLVSSPYHRLLYMMNIPGGSSNVASKNINGEVNLI